MFILILLFGLFSRLIDVKNYDEAYLTKCLLHDISEKRAVVVDDMCVNASKHHAKYLADKQTIGHYEDSSYPGALYSIDERKVDGEICLSYKAFSADLHITYEQLAERMIAAWLASPEHKEVLLNKKLGRIGISTVYNTKDDTYYSVISFKYN